jgi:Zn-dependent protease
MYDFTAQQFALRLAALLLLIAVQGGAIAACAVLLGDKGPRQDGRLILSPLIHLDLLGLLGGLLFSIGWTKPIAIDPTNLKGGRAALIAIVLAPFGATLAVILLLGLLRQMLLPHLSDIAAQTLFALVDVTGGLGIWFALANLLPLPPFAGAHLLTALYPGLRWARFQIQAGLAMLVLAGIGLLAALLGPAQGALAGLLLRH